ncbi:MAG: SDR family NAD(P)-dependent oxidoreductase [Gluconobacter potus]|uniref:Protein CapI n=1 Tax=Gluconobacter potus TaxID=2724927 RepID=A0A149QXQ6_9PROT|nr:SDR family NAD(P)-dependent oxidoreductase [Gluconobacter potus]MBF0865712.1 SDR family NAD(P)-dependent oxidoreductase [Gluconobacter sp. R71656]MBF0868802.1 SDR family NAD(P)-dependent oxidoreductase [Gluconobacter sp. R75628]MBF0874784.1 SDR family NAD(P)-dependent oxidoreductase [Gluconobacter sp. R75629]KXV02103.1 protein CapI [Gluconobacter potus]MBF0883742.1 SDR family NAD(P)-dependent oxidoreductase [Gluconobacter potus]
MKVLVTGVAGFIGFHVAQALLKQGMEVVGVDTLNAYYDPALKAARLEQLEPYPGFSFLKVDVASPAAMQDLVARHPDLEGVIHLAAQAGVRYSMVDPYSYVTSNVMGQVALLEACRHLKKLTHVVYASSSSVYGRNQSVPFRETDRVELPSSVYAVTKRAAELMSESYAYLHSIPQTGLRFFTVYGPWGRPDMAYYGFAKAISEGRPVTLYEGKHLSRDFTYIDDIVRGVQQVLGRPPEAGMSRVLNLGGDKPERVTRMIELLEQNLGKKAFVERRPRPVADMESTWASLENVREFCGWKPAVSFEDGMKEFCLWFRKFHGI